MSQLARRIRKLPGIRSVDRMLCRHYLGQDNREPHKRGHFSSPLPDIAEVRQRAEELFARDVKLEASIDLREAAQRELLDRIIEYAADFDWPASPTPDRRYHTGMGFFGIFDAMFLYAMMRHIRPRRVIEVGSGDSSAMMLDTSARFLDNDVRFTFIEPFPVRLNEALTASDRERCSVREQFVQQVPLDVFRELQAGDILFIDSSHVSRIGSDVNFLVFDVLPQLRAGVYVHFHDIHWPFEYPQRWIEQGRAWNEAYLLRAFLQYNSAFEITMFNSYMNWKHQSVLAERLPRVLAVEGGSLWLRKTGGTEDER